MHTHIPCSVCLSLQDSGLAHFRMHVNNLTHEELLHGREQYVLHGAGPLKKKKDIGPTNILFQLANYHTYACLGGPLSGLSPVKLLRKMLNSGRYFPSATWAYRGQGRGLDVHKFTAIWKAATNPECVPNYYLCFPTHLGTARPCCPLLCRTFLHP